MIGASDARVTERSCDLASAKDMISCGQQAECMHGSKRGAFRGNTASLNTIKHTILSTRTCMHGYNTKVRWWSLKK